MVIVGGTFEFEPLRDKFIESRVDMMRTARRARCIEYTFGADPLDPERHPVRGSGRIRRTRRPHRRPTRRSTAVRAWYPTDLVFDHDLRRRRRAVCSEDPTHHRG